MTFLAQFYASPDRFNIPGALCMQLYQCLAIDWQSLPPELNFGGYIAVLYLTEAEEIRVELI
jgi:hypothetical protein